MSDAPSNLHLEWARLFVRALVASGVTDLVVSPGSRSTPLVLAAAAEPELRCHAILDERSAAFFALGQARATGRPSALLCTSGTAGAHYLPAVIEADAAGLPLVVLTADRSWEAHDCGASQTISQLGLFAGFARHVADVGQPDASSGALRAVVRVAARAVAEATGLRPGPAHVNLHFRKPLEAVDTLEAEPWRDEVDALAARVPPRSYAPSSEPNARAVRELAGRILRTERGVIVCGPSPAFGDGDALRAAVGELARKAGLAVLAEATSQVRFGAARPGAILCSSFDALLRAPEVRAHLAPELVLELGAPATSSAWANALADYRGVARYVVGPRGFFDPDGSATAFVRADPAAFCHAVAAMLPERARPSPYAATFARLDAVATELVEQAVSGDVLCEGAAARRLVGSAPDGALLAVGNSLPVRHLDTYCPAGGRALPVLSQRGASGIDGLVSGAVGAAVATRRPLALLVGDLSFAHDVAGLAAARSVDTPFIVLVLQNGGGRIFDQLPIARSAAPELLERFFTTPMAVDLGALSLAYGARFAQVRTPAELDAALVCAWTTAGTTVIEAIVGSGEAAHVARLRAAIACAASAAISAGLGAASVQTTGMREETV